MVGLYMPSMAMLMLPLSLYIAILITFGRLYAESEITVMNATGMGNALLIRSAFYLALLTGSFAAFNSLWLTPWANDQELKVLEKLEADSGLNLLMAGQIQSTPDGRAVIFIDSMSEQNKTLHQVFVAQPLPSDKMRPNVVVADLGHISELEDGRQVLELDQGVRYEGLPTRLDYSITDYDAYQVLIGQRAIREKNRDWDAMPTLQLMGMADLSAKAEMQWRISLIICIPILVMIVVPLSAVNPRQGRFAKLFPAILIYLTYFLSISAAKSAIEDGKLEPVIGIWSVHLIALCIAIGINSADSYFVRQLKYRLRNSS